MYACLVSNTSISAGASVSAPLSAIETLRASFFSISARVLTRQKTGPPAEAETIQNEMEMKDKKTRKVLRMILNLPSIEVIEPARLVLELKSSNRLQKFQQPPE